MKRSFALLALSLACVAAHSAEPSVEKEKASIQTTAHKAILEKFAEHPNFLLKYRPSDNMPEITSEALITGVGDRGTVARMNAGIERIGVIPRLNVLPCDTGCVGNPDYEKAVRGFIDNYESAARQGHYDFRGTMTVKVRWFKQRGFLERKVPIPGNRDVFSISFPLEGKLVTLSRQSTEAPMDALTTEVSGLLGGMLSLQMGIGVKPSPLQALLPDRERTWMAALSSGLAPINRALDMIFGAENRRSRIEPMTEADKVLLPAVDGIEPNEIEPLSAPVFLF